MKVSILILTYNEEANLPRCLAALTWCDDIIVIDSGSQDRTVEIAKAAGARVLHRPFDDFARQRNFGLDEGHPRHGIDAYQVPSKTMLHETWLKHSGMYPTYQVRLGHKDRLRFIQVGHGQREDLPGKRVGTFAEPYLHYNFSHGLAAWLKKHVRYAEDEARLLVEQRRGQLSTTAERDTGSGVERRRALKSMANRLPLMLRPIARFVYVFIWRRGFLDGRRGALYALMLSVYEGMIGVIAADLLENRPAAAEKSDPSPPATRAEHVSTSIREGISR